MVWKTLAVLMAAITMAAALASARRADDPHAQLASGSLSPAICYGCHSDLLAKGYMHPVEMRPQRAMVPKDLPLSPAGKVTCTTCHDVRGDRLTPFGTASHYLRRLEPGKAFCDSCHGGGLDRGSGHAAALGEAHFRSEYIVTDPGQEIDPMSKNCISCHDGTFASSVSIKAGIWRHSRPTVAAAAGSVEATSADTVSTTGVAGSATVTMTTTATTVNPMGSAGLAPLTGLAAMSNHPVGIDYELARTRYGRKTDLRPIGMVDPRVAFFDGKIGCGSCHNPYSQEHSGLVMSNGRSALCLACHMVDQ